MAKMMRTEPTLVDRLLEIVPGAEVIVEEIVHLTHSDQAIVTLFPQSKYAEFDEEYRDPTHLGQSLNQLVEYLRSKGYSTNLK